jgi:hypothetical protein
MSFLFGVSNNWFTFFPGQWWYNLFIFFVLWDVIAMCTALPSRNFSVFSNTRYAFFTQLKMIILKEKHWFG